MNKAIRVGITSIFFCLVQILQASLNPVSAQPITEVPSYAALVFTIPQLNTPQSAAQVIRETQRIIELLDQHKLPATFLLSPTALSNRELITVLYSGSTQINTGLLLDITPEMVKQTVFHGDRTLQWDPKYRMISSYSVTDRPFILNTAMNEFSKINGHFPQVVALWHVDGASAKFLSEKYGVKAFIIPSEHQRTPISEVWGQWMGRPYYPSQNHILFPAQKVDNKVSALVIPWQLPDPFQNIPEATNPLSSNDLFNSYLQPIGGTYGFAIWSHDITTNMNLQLPVIETQMSFLADRVKTASQLKAVTIQEFTDWYLQTYPELSPEETISFSQSGENTNIKIDWELKHQYRKGWLHQAANEPILIDYHPYPENFPEPYLVQENPFESVTISVPAVMDQYIRNSPSQGLNSNQNKYQIPYTFDFILIVSVWIVIALIFWINSSDPTAWIAILVGSSMWMLTMVKNGLWNSFGIGFWGPHGHDAIWHIAVSQQIASGQGLQNPILAGESLSNYHFLFNFILSGIHSITQIPIPYIYFQIIPFIFALLIGTGVFQLTNRLFQNVATARVAVILTYVVGNAGWLVGVIRYWNLNSETMFWAQQSISTLLNPPYALSLIFLLFGLAYLYDYLKKPSRLAAATSILGLSLLAQTKVYASILVILGLWIVISLFLISFLSFHRQKIFKQSIAQTWKTFASNQIQMRLIIAALCITLLSILITLPFASNIENVFIWNPLWFVHSMIGAHDRLNLPILDQARAAYQQTNILKYVIIEAGALVIFFLGNLWTRIIGICFLCIAAFKQKSWLKNFTLVDAVLISMALISFLIPLFFTQRGTVWNTIQFMYYGLFIITLYTARGLSTWIKPKQLLVIAVTLIVLLNIPTTIGTLTQYIPSRPPSRIPAEELAALNFLRTLPRGHVLVAPYDASYARKFDIPFPLSVYTSTAYVSAYSGQPSVYADQVNLEIIGVDWQSRLEIIQGFFNATRPKIALPYLKQLDVDYLYLLKGQRMGVNPEHIGFQKIYDNGLVVIFHYNRG